MNIITGVSSNKFLNFNLVFFVLLVFCRDIINVNVPPLVFVLLMSIMASVCSYKIIVNYICFLIPFFIGVHTVGLFVLLLFLIIRSKKLNIFQFCFTIIIIFLELLHLTFYKFNIDFLLFALYSVFVASFFFIIFDDNLDNEGHKDCLRYYVYGVACCLLIILIHSISIYGIDSLSQGFRIGDDGNNFEANKSVKYLTTNANTIAYFSITAFACLLLRDKIWTNKFLYIYSLVVVLLAGALSVSRTWLLLLILLLICYIIQSKLNHKILFLAFIPVIFLVLYQLFPFFFDNIILSFTIRFEDDSMETAGGRVGIFESYNDWMSNHPEKNFTGVGALYYTDYTGINRAMHNGIQQIYVCYGMLGLFLYFLAMVIFFFKYKIFSKLHWLRFLPILSALIFTQSIQFLNPFTLMMPFVVMVQALKYDE